MVAGSTVFATIVNPCSTSAFSPLIQSGGIVFSRPLECAFTPNNQHINI